MLAVDPILDIEKDSVAPHVVQPGFGIGPRARWGRGRNDLEAVGENAACQYGISSSAMADEYEVVRIPDFWLRCQELARLKSVNRHSRPSVVERLLSVGGEVVGPQVDFYGHRACPPATHIERQGGVSLLRKPSGHVFHVVSRGTIRRALTDTVRDDKTRKRLTRTWRRNVVWDGEYATEANR